jgi:hypothetical protein
VEVTTPEPDYFPGFLNPFQVFQTMVRVGEWPGYQLTSTCIYTVRQNGVDMTCDGPRLEGISGDYNCQPTENERFVLSGGGAYYEMTLAGRYE